MYKVVIKDHLGNSLEVIHLMKRPTMGFLKRVRLKHSTRLKAVAQVEVYHLETNYAGQLIERVS